MALAQSLPRLFVGRVISAITSASFTTANAYIADVTPPEKRAAAFGMIGMAFGIGFIIGPAIGGLLGEIDLRRRSGSRRCCRWPTSATAGSCCPNRCRRKAHALRLGARQPARLAGAPLALPGGVRPGGVLFLMHLAHLVYPSTFVLFADYRFAWGPSEVGYMLAMVGVCSGSSRAG